MFKHPVLLVIISLLSLAALLAAGILLAHRPNESASVGSFANSGDIEMMLNALKVKPEKLGKVRGVLADDHWSVKHRCSTRARVLQEESATPLKYFSGSKCKPMSGAWTSPYDGLDYTGPQFLEIDHMVPRKEAWQSGAWKWDKERQKAFKNDLGYGPSLIAVTASENGRGGKGDKEPGLGVDYYLPPKIEYRCTYVAEWIAVKWRWSLSVDSAEKSNLQNLLNACTRDVKIPFPVKATLPSEG